MLYKNFYNAYNCKLSELYLIIILIIKISLIYIQIIFGERNKLEIRESLCILLK